MSGIKNIKKKLKGFQVRPPNAEVIKKVLLYIPYVVVFYVVNKCTWLYQYCRGSTVVDRLMVLLMNYPLAFKKLLPSIQPKSLAAGTIAAVSVWAVVYFKGKNGKKFRQGEEYGSARWGNEKDIAPFIDPVFENNILLTQTERLTMNSRPKKPKYARNKNVIVIGGSGSGKTRFYVKPQLMQMPDNVSFVVTDPKGTIIVECGKMLARGTPKKDKNGKILRDKNGRVVMAPYKIKVLNTINFAKSMHYNPFHYIRSEKDILKLVNTIMVNTKGEGEKSSEDFWTKAERLLYCALIGYIYYEAPEEEQNFSTLLEFINASETREEDEEFKNAVDLLFEELERDEPNHFAVRQYKKYKLAAGKTAKSILISCGPPRVYKDPGKPGSLKAGMSGYEDLLSFIKVKYFFQIHFRISIYGFLLSAQPFSAILTAASGKQACEPIPRSSTARFLTATSPLTAVSRAGYPCTSRIPRGGMP